MGETLSRAGGLPVCIKPAAGRRTLDQGFLLLLERGEIFHHHYQPARGAHHPDRAVRQAQLIQQSRNPRSELFQSALQVSRRQLLRPDLQQKIRRGSRIICRYSFSCADHFRRSLFFQERELQRTPLRHIGFRDAVRHIPHAAEHSLPFGHAHRPARIQDVKSV